jgi:SH3-like domain-containing protein
MKGVPLKAKAAGFFARIFARILAGMDRALAAAVLSFTLLALLTAHPAQAAPQTNNAANNSANGATNGSGVGAGIGPVSGLPMPRFVSLKSDRVNLREGPSKDHRTAWVFQRAGLPVEITAEYDKWRRIRDSEGAEGWVLQSLLSGRRTALVAPWKKVDSLPLRAQASSSAGITAHLQPGVLGNVRKCDGNWCRIFGDGFDGYIEQNDLWGVYSGEKYEQ